MKITYPTWKIKGSPTPYEMLVVCDKCGFADWTTAGWPAVKYCTNTSGTGGSMGNLPSHGRLREATKKEYVEGKAALKVIVS